MNEFEKKWQEQRFKAIPGDWRKEILLHANAKAPEKRSVLAALNQHITVLLWPHPRAWAGLGAVWLLILAVNFVTNSDSSSTRRQIPGPSAEYWTGLSDQERLLTQLIAPKEPTPAAEPPKRSTPGPRSESPRRLITA